MCNKVKGVNLIMFFSLFSQPHMEKCPSLQQNAKLKCSGFSGAEFSFRTKPLIFPETFLLSFTETEQYGRGIKAALKKHYFIIS